MKDFDVNKTQEYLKEMADILYRERDALDWCEILTHLSQKEDVDPENFRYKIKRIYGGMGYLNDRVVVSVDGSYDCEINNEFAKARSALYQIL